MTEDIQEFVATCNIGCAAATPKNSPPPMVIRETPEEVWQHLAADFRYVGTLQGVGGYIGLPGLARWGQHFD